MERTTDRILWFTTGALLLSLGGLMLLGALGHRADASALARDARSVEGTVLRVAHATSRSSMRADVRLDDGLVVTVPLSSAVPVGAAMTLQQSLDRPSAIRAIGHHGRRWQRLAAMSLLPLGGGVACLMAVARKPRVRLVPPIEDA